MEKLTLLSLDSTDILFAGSNGITIVEQMLKLNVSGSIKGG